MAPMRKTVAGVLPLNVFLQQLLNPPSPEKAEYSLPSSHASAMHDRNRRIVLREGDRVIQCSNNYQKDVFNGDIGFVIKAKSATRELWVQYQGKWLEAACIVLAAVQPQQTAFPLLNTPDSTSQPTKTNSANYSNAGMHLQR